MNVYFTSSLFFTQIFVPVLTITLTHSTNKETTIFSMAFCRCYMLQSRYFEKFGASCDFSAIISRGSIYEVAFFWGDLWSVTLNCRKAIYIGKTSTNRQYCSFSSFLTSVVVPSLLFQVDFALDSATPLPFFVSAIDFDVIMALPLIEHMLILKHYEIKSTSFQVNEFLLPLTNIFNLSFIVFWNSKCI